MKHLTILFFCSLTYFSFSQPALLPHIGLDTEPLPSDVISEVDASTVLLSEVGYFVGDLVNDFTLFTPEGVPFTLSEALGNDKPSVVISGSYTCPKFRDSFGVINTLATEYADSVDLVVVYTIEAHPYLDISPYSGEVDTGQENYQAGILYQQPDNFQERLDIIADMIADSQMSFPNGQIAFEIYVDGPENRWLEYYGPAANICYFIDPTGHVINRHDWLQLYPNDIFEEITCYFQGLEEEEEEVPTGTFEFNTITDVLVTGIAGETIYTEAILSNQSDEPVLVAVERVASDLPEGWNTAMCLDICLPPQYTYYECYLEPGQTQTYHNYFYTNEIAGLGSADIVFTNVDDASNTYSITFYGETTVVVEEDDSIESAFDAEMVTSIDAFSMDQVLIYPNPANEIVSFKGLSGTDFTIFNSTGKRMGQFRADAFTESINVSDWKPGLYFLTADDFGGAMKFVVVD